MSRILVVDDDPDIRNLVGTYLKADGHTVEFAVNGIAGIGAALAQMPDLIVTDFQMPGMDGFALFNAVRANAEKKVPVVMITAHHSREMMQKALGLGIDDFIAKPITRDELAKIVAPLVSPRAERRPAPTTRTLEATRSFGSAVCVQVGRLEAFMMQLNKAELAELLQQFKTGVAQSVQEDGGWLVTDIAHHLLMGFPEEGTKNHAARALHCALKAVLCAQRLKPWIARRFAGRDLPEFLVAVGIHTGQILVRAPRGGGEGELKGEAVDVAATLAASIHSLRWSVAASQATAQASQFGFLAGRTAQVQGTTGEIGAIEVKGFAPPVVPKPPAPQPPKPAAAPAPAPVPPKAPAKAPAKAAAKAPTKAPPKASAKAPEKAPAPAPVAAPAPAPAPAPVPAPAPEPAPVSAHTATLVEAAVDRNATLVTAAAAIPKPAAAPAEPVAGPAPKPAPKKHPTKRMPAIKPVPPPPPPKGASSFAPPPKEVALPPPVDPFADRTVVLKLADNGISAVHLVLPKAGGSQEVLKGFLINEDPKDKKQTKRRVVQGFIEQYQALRMLEHPNIARTTDIGMSATHLFVAQEYCAGGDLRNLIAQGMAADDAIKAVLRIAGGLKAAHAKGFVHGDLRPANVMIREDGSFALVDFALAKVVEYAIAEGESGVMLRTPDYLSPEMINGQAADVRTDIYTLGLLLHEMLTGKRAYDSPDLSKVMMDQLNAPVPTLPEAHARFQPLLDKLMAKKLDDRFESVGDVIAFMSEAKLQG